MAESGIKPMARFERLFQEKLVKLRRQVVVQTLAAESQSPPAPRPDPKEKSLPVPRFPLHGPTHSLKRATRVIEEDMLNNEASTIAAFTPSNAENPSSTTNTANLAMPDIPASEVTTAPDASTSDTLQCICELSTSCPLAAKKGVKHCQNSVALVYSRIPKRTIRGSVPERKAFSVKQQAKLKRANDEALTILTLFSKSLTAGPGDVRRIFDNMRAALQKLPFLEIDHSQNLIGRFLDERTGLLAIVNSTTVPYDVKLDADMLRIRWQRNDFNPHLLRGIKVQRTEAKEAGGNGGVSRRLDPEQDKLRFSPNFIGEGHLRNGQWFPFQITAVRDGAVSEVEAGISGYDGVATAVVLNSSAKGRSYADIDQGYEVYYCGTRGKDGNVSSGTMLLLESKKKGIPIRLLRGAKLSITNPYRPAAGLRYDGLYKVAGYEILDEEAKLYRFKMIRIPGQTPIRHKGKEARPTIQEQRELELVSSSLSASRLPKEKKRKQS